jgi:small redox-active disulfide protein 2
MKTMLFFGKKKETKTEETKVHSEGRDNAATVSIKVLGSGCKNCQALLQNTKETVSTLHLPADIEYVTDMQKVAQYGVMSTPALVVNEQVVSMGRVLKPADVQELLKKIGIA